MRYPSQALLWNAVVLSWPALVMQICAAVAILFLIDLALDPDTDTRGIIEAADLVLMGSVTFVYVATLHGMQSPGRASSTLGFPYRSEFALPVSTLTLFLTPLLYFCALVQVALFVPGLIINALILHVDVSYLTISFIMFQFTFVSLLLTWWTRNALASFAGWILGFYLFAYGYLLPDFSRTEGSWIITANAASDYLTPLLISATLSVLAYFGVQRQRSGETLLEIGHGVEENGARASLRNIIPTPVAECPTHSPLRAEFWKERQLSGETRAIVGGLAGAAITLGILGAMGYFVPVALDPVRFSNVTLLFVAMYLAVCVGLTAYMFGVRYENGTARVSVHDRTVALSTARLTGTRVSVALISTLLAGVVMFAAVWILGPLVIDDFSTMRATLIDSLGFITQQGFASGVLRLTLILLGFLTGLTLFSIALTWFMLHSRRSAIGLAGAAAYAFLLTTVLDILVSEADDFIRLLDTALLLHAWILLLAIPIAMVKIFRDLLLDCVITTQQMAWLIAAALIPFALNCSWLYSSSHFDALNSDLGITALSYLTLQGAFPMLAAIAALWTSNRLRHG